MFESDHPTLSDLQRYHRELDAAKGFYTDLYYNALLLQEEVGEVSSAVAQLWRAEQRAGDQGVALTHHRDALAEELADCLAYLVKMANYAGIDLEAAYLVKMRRNVRRVWRTQDKDDEA